MASETTVQTSCIQDDKETDECRENIPPGVTAAAGTSKLKVQGEDVEGDSSTQLSGGNEPCFDTCTFSTPAPTSSSGGVKAKSRLSGLQSALTPILKYLNIGNKRPSPEPLKHGNSSSGYTAANSQKSTGGNSKHPKSDFSSGHSGRSLGDVNASVSWLDDEHLPEITFLDATCDDTMQLTRNDSALPDSVPATPVKAGSVKGKQPFQLSSSTSLNGTAQKPCPQSTSLSHVQSNASNSKVESEAQATDLASTVATNSTETVKPNSKPGGLGDVQDRTLDGHSLQKSSSSTLLGESSATTLCLQNNTFEAKPPLDQNGTIATESHQTTMEKPYKFCSAAISARDPNAKVADTPARMNAPLRWLDDRDFPEITLLDVTCDSELSPRVETPSMEVTQDISPDSLQKNVPTSELGGQIVAEHGTLDMTPSEGLSSTLDGNTTHTVSSINEQSDKCAGEHVTTKASLEVTRDISMGSVLEDSRPSVEPNEQNVVKIQTTAEATHLANVTRDISSSSDMSVQGATSDTRSNTSSNNATFELHGEPVATSDTVEVNKDELLSSHDTELASKIPPQPSPKTSGSANGTFTVQAPNLRASTNLNTTADIASSQNKTQDLCNVNSPKVESETKDVGPSVCKNTTENSPVMDQNGLAVKASASCDVKNATFDRHSLQKSSNNTVSGEGVATTFCLQNNTFDSKPASRQNGTITLSETSSSNGHQDTLDKASPLKVNSLTSNIDNKSEIQPPELSKHDATTASTDPTAKVDTPESTLEADPAVEVPTGGGPHETKDPSRSGLPVTDGLSDSLDHQSMNTDNNKVNTFNLDDTLDLRADSLITSTPMTNCKVFNYMAEREEGKAMGAQKKLYGDASSKPDTQASSDVPSNIVCDRKTFLTQPAAKSLLPASKAASHLWKYKPAPAHPGRFEPSASGLPMTRQRTQAEALKNTAVPHAPQLTTGTSSSYNLRATTTGMKQPISGLRKPQLSSIPSGTQRAAQGLKLPSGRSNAPASSSTDKACGPIVTNPVTKTSQAKKHPLNRGEALPLAKRKKTDAPLPSGSAGASTSSCDAANTAKNPKQPTTSQRALPAKTQRDDTAVPASTAETSTSCDGVSRARALKQPASSHRALPAKPQGPGCAKCVALEQQLKMKSEEIKRLKEELLKYSKQEEEC